MLANVGSFVCIATRKIQASNAPFIAENGLAFTTNSVRPRELRENHFTLIQFCRKGCSQSLRTGHCSATDMKTDSRRQSIGRNGRQKTIGTLRYTSSQVFETLLM